MAFRVIHFSRRDGFPRSSCSPSLFHLRPPSSGDDFRFWVFVVWVWVFISSCILVFVWGQHILFLTAITRRVPFYLVLLVGCAFFCYFCPHAPFIQLPLRVKFPWDLPHNPLPPSVFRRFFSSPRIFSFPPCGKVVVFFFL